MGNASWLEQYYVSDIRPMLEEGVSQVRIREALKEKYGVEVPRSTLSDFLKSLEEGNGRMPSPAAMAYDGWREDLLARHEALAQELCSHMARLIADGQEAERASEARHGALEALAARMEAASGFKTWVKASLYTGPVWGVVCGLVFHWLVT